MTTTLNPRIWTQANVVVSTGALYCLAATTEHCLTMEEHHHQHHPERSYHVFLLGPKLLRRRISKQLASSSSSSSSSTSSFLLLASTGGTHLAQHGGHLLPLSLGAQVGAELPLGYLEGTLVLADLKELSDTLLVGGEACDLADELAHEGGALAELALGGRRTLGDVALGHLVTAVEPHGDAVAHDGRRHRCC
jgi:hypothetical protein